jgi:flagellar biosynthesis GTPase FlhF
VINKLINLANYLDQSGFKKEADEINALVKRAEIYEIVNPDTGEVFYTDSPNSEQSVWLAQQEAEAAKEEEEKAAEHERELQKRRDEDPVRLAEEEVRKDRELQTRYEDELKEVETYEQYQRDTEERAEQAGIDSQRRYREEQAAKAAAREAEKQEGWSWEKVMGLVVEIGDPTGITGWDEVGPANTRMHQQIAMAGFGSPRTWWEVLLFLLALLGALPIVGKLGKLGKIPKWLKGEDITQALKIVDDIDAIDNPLIRRTIQSSPPYKKIKSPEVQSHFQRVAREAHHGSRTGRETVPAVGRSSRKAEDLARQRSVVAARVTNRIPWADKTIWIHKREGGGTYQIVAVNSGGKPTLFYRSSGTNPGRRPDGSVIPPVRGRWHNMYGFSTGPQRSSWFMKKDKHLTGEALDISDDLSILDNAAQGPGIASLPGFSVKSYDTAWNPEGFSEMAKFNQWADRLGAIPDYWKNYYDVPGINVDQAGAAAKYGSRWSEKVFDVQY